VETVQRPSRQRPHGVPAAPARVAPATANRDTAAPVSDEQDAAAPGAGVPDTAEQRKGARTPARTRYRQAEIDRVRS
jgi:hypothetical protein